MIRNFYSFHTKIYIWKIIEQNNSIWFFDASGNIVKTHKNVSQNPFLYSIVAHDSNLKQNIPIAEFLTKG